MKVKPCVGNTAMTQQCKHMCLFKITRNTYFLMIH